MSRKNKKSPNKKVFALVLCFAVSLFMSFFTLFIAADTALLNIDHTFSKADVEEFGSDVARDFELQGKTLAAKSGVEYEVISSVINVNKIKKDVNEYFGLIKTDGLITAGQIVNEEAISTAIYNNILSSDIGITELQKQNAKIFADKTATLYKETLVIEDSDKAVSISNGFKVASLIVVPFFVVVCALLVLAMISFNGKFKKHRLLRRFSLIFSTTGLTTSVLSFVMKFTDTIRKISFVTDQRDYNLYLDLFENFFNVTLILGLINIVIGIILFIIWRQTAIAKNRE